MGLIIHRVIKENIQMVEVPRSAARDLKVHLLAFSCQEKLCQTGIKVWDNPCLLTSSPSQTPLRNCK